MRIQSKGKAEMSTNRVSQFEGLRRGNGRLLERALVVVRCVEWPALVVVGRVNVEQSGLVERVGPAADGLGSHLRRTAPVGQKVCLQAQNGYALQRGGGSERKCPKERPVPHRIQRKRARFNTLARREPLCDREGRGLRGLVESSNECDDSNEDEGPEAHRAVHRLVRR